MTTDEKIALLDKLVGEMMTRVLELERWTYDVAAWMLSHQQADARVILRRRVRG